MRNALGFVKLPYTEWWP